MRIIYNIFISFILIIFLYLNFKLYYEPKYIKIDHVKINQDILNQLNFIGYELRERNAGQRMQQLFPEGFLFMNVLYGLAWCEIGNNLTVNTNLWKKAISEARWAFNQIESPICRNHFNENLSPAYGAFYVGWSNYLLGKILTIQNRTELDSCEKNKFIKNCEDLSNAFNSSMSPFIESYPSAVWPADALIGMASLALYDKIFPRKYDTILQIWLKKVKERLDPKTGLIPHSVYYKTGFPSEGARGSSQTLMNRFLIEIDPEFAIAQYKIYREKFLTSIFGLPVVREYPKGVYGSGDVDSGPVILGVGFAATIIAPGTFNVFKDSKLALSLNQTIETFGFPLTFNQKKKYILGKLPIADAFLAWAKIAPENKLKEFNKIENTFWRIQFHTISFIIILILLLPIFIFQNKKTKMS